MTAKGYRKIVAGIAAVFFFFLLISPELPAQAAPELSLTVTYDARCGAPSTFTVHASGGSGNYMYYLGNVTRNGDDGQYFVVDPSRLPGYQASPDFQFTFCTSGVYYLHFYVMDKGVTPVVTQRAIVTVNLNDPAYPSAEAIADAVAAQCLAACHTEYDRALWLHDWLVDHCSYDYSYLYCGSEGALARGTGTCESYHRAYTMLLNRVGIANGRMEGNGHVWTAVRMDGNWYQVDVTWDDNGYSYRTYENYIYFGLNDALMKTVHSGHNPHAGYESNALANHALIRNGAITQWSDPLAASVQENLNAGKTSFSVPVSSTLPPSYETILYNLAAYQLSGQSWGNTGNTVRLQASYSAGQMNFSAVYTPISTAPGTSAQAPDSKPTSPDSKPISSGKKPASSGTKPTSSGTKPTSSGTEKPGAINTPGDELTSDTNLDPDREASSETSLAWEETSEITGDSESASHFKDASLSGEYPSKNNKDSQSGLSEEALSSAEEHLAVQDSGSGSGRNKPIILCGVLLLLLLISVWIFAYIKRRKHA